MDGGKADLLDWYASKGAPLYGFIAEQEWCPGQVVGLPGREAGQWPILIDGQSEPRNLCWSLLRPRGGNFNKATTALTSSCGAVKHAALSVRTSFAIRPPPNTARRQWLREKVERDAQRNWDVFYRDHTVNFFKDRHWRMIARFPTDFGDDQCQWCPRGCFGYR